LKDKSTIILNFLTFIGFILYGVGIYIETKLLNKRWGNSEVDFSIQLFGPLIGVIVVVLIGFLILIITYSFSYLKTTNIFLCWFWILSLYQCSINTFLSINNLPNEPINIFFKSIWPYFWYPMKELVFIIISIILTFIWLKKIKKIKFSRLDIILIVSISFLLWIAIAISQITIINSELNNVYS